MSDDEFEKQIADRLYKDANATLEVVPEGATITKFGEMTERQIQWVAEEEAKEAKWRQKGMLDFYAGKNQTGAKITFMPISKAKMEGR